LQVAARNAYTADLIACFFQGVANPLSVNYHAMHTLARAAAKAKLERFNTPNADNTRNLIFGCTGYDPWNDWQWPARGMNALATRVRLNEILRVRHSLAHGAPVMPGFAWNRNPSGQTRLTVSVLDWMRRFFDHLVATTDDGPRAHVATTFGITAPW
jgi:hypothetical protein